MQHFILSTKTKDLSFALQFLSMWFGKNTRLADISAEEFEKVYRLCIRVPKDRIIAESENVQTDR